MDCQKIFLEIGISGWQNFFFSCWIGQRKEINVFFLSKREKDVETFSLKLSFVLNFKLVIWLSYFLFLICFFKKGV